MSERPRPAVTIEATSFYSPNPYKYGSSTEPGKGEVANFTALQELTLARSIATALRAESINSRQIILSDDVSPREKQRTSVDGWRWERFISRPILQIQHDFPEVETVYQEHDFIPAGMSTIKHLKEEVIKSSYYRLSEDGKSIIMGSGKNRERIRLVGYNDEYPDLPSCEVLDLSMYQKKLTETPEVITLLPQSYKAQQERVRKLFELLGQDPHVTVGYHDEEGKIVDISQWHSLPNPLSKKIADILSNASSVA